MTHNEKQTRLLVILINCISARSASEILCIRSECTFLFSNLLITSLCYSSANSLFDIFSFLFAPPEADLSRVARIDFVAKASDRMVRK